MLTSVKLRIQVLTIHGGLALCLGLIFFYLHAAMITPLFEVVAVANVILLSAAALILAAITDWFAAFDGRMNSIHRFGFYLLAGIALAVAGAYLVYSPTGSLRLLIGFAAIHALAFGVSTMRFASKATNYPRNRWGMYFFGIASILFAGTMAATTRGLNNRSATAMLSCYLCFIGVKMLFFAWDFHRAFTISEKVVAS